MNAGKTTNFIFNVEGLSLAQEAIAEINAIATRSKIMDRLKALRAAGGSLVFNGIERRVFENNLILIDTRLPEILAHLVLTFYTSGKSSIADLVDLVSEANPLGFDVSDEHRFHAYKIKRFLTDVALGMMPSVVWDGQYDATGGYLVIKEDGEVLCYHIYNKNQFEDYLFHHTKLETASSRRHGFGSVMKEHGDLRIKLNLQIRFIK